MKYVYWGVVCKTTGCGLIPAKFIGEYQGKYLYERPENLPQFWDVPCAGCKETHRYTPHDLEVKSIDFPPPPSFREWW